MSDGIAAGDHRSAHVVNAFRQQGEIAGREQLEFQRFWVVCRFGEDMAWISTAAAGARIAAINGGCSGVPLSAICCSITCFAPIGQTL